MARRDLVRILPADSRIHIERVIVKFYVYGHHKYDSRSFRAVSYAPALGKLTSHVLESIGKASLTRAL
jgi:hypothetical protein